MAQRRREFFDAFWDPYSDQPQVIRDRGLKRRLRLAALGEFLTLGLSAAVAGPLVAARYAWPGAFLQPPPARGDFLGLGVSPHPALSELLSELPVRQLLIRCPVAAGREQARVLATIRGLPQYEWLVVLAQDRGAVCRPRAWAAQVTALARQLPPQVTAVQLGNAVNRLKWGCATIAEYLDLLEATVPALRRARPGLLIAGSSVIDFEPVLTLRSLINGYRHRLDAMSALLYVDRRGAPEARQYGFFDTAGKIRSTAAMLACAPRHGKRLWLTEVNWPLQGQAPWAPTSEKECVDEATAAEYLQRYIATAWASQLVERVYPWQLVARGYGLIEERDGQLRRRPAFTALARWLKQA